MAAVEPVFSERQVEILTSRGIPMSAVQTDDILPVQTDGELPEHELIPGYWTEEKGYLPGLLFWWRSPDGQTVVPQLRPDEAVVDVKTGDVKKYVFPPDAPSILHEARSVSDATSDILLTEGTCQTRAAAAFAPPGMGVYGIAGCQSWMKCGVPTRDLQVVEGRTLFICLDADAATNLNVYEAGVALREACLAQGATSVFFIRVPGGGKSGLDDVLGGQDEEKRPGYLARLIEMARTRKSAEKPDAPAASKPKARGSAAAGGQQSPFFSNTGGLLVQTLASTVIGNQPVALTRENKIAIYRNGVYQLDGTAFTGEVGRLLGEQYRISHESNTEKYTVGQLALSGIKLPERQSEPLCNVLNGMVDLRTGELVPHDPRYLSSVQLPVTWEPGAACPTYEAWAKEQVGDQLEDLEECVSLMLDPSITPTKAVFLFGPSRSGKGTYLRLLQAIAGPDNTTGVSLHQLADDRFAAANLYGKILNASGDLSAAHVEDISMFKMLTGEDLIQANRKYGQQFSFTNRALFAFSANELPTVGESSRAYSERIKPFHFDKSFAGAEDPTLERQILAELPGILVRFVDAYRRRMARGRPLETDPRVRELFEEASDRVRQFVRECCEILPLETTRGGNANATSATTAQLHGAFKQWVEDEGRAPLAKGKMKVRLANIPGVSEQVSSGRSRGWNLRLLPRPEWGQRERTPARSVLEDHGSGESKSEDLPNSGTLSVWTQPLPDVETHVPDLGSEESRGASYGVKLTKFQTSAPTCDDAVTSDGVPLGDPLALLLPLAEPADLTSEWRICPDCDQSEALTPSGFIYACPRCHPASFDNDREGGV